MHKTQAKNSSLVQGVENPAPNNNETIEAFTELERGIFAALETYSNVHRGSGQYSIVSTHLFEQAREIVLEYLGLIKGKYKVIFCTPRRALALKSKLEPESYKTISSQDIGLPLGICALAVDRKALPAGTPIQTGGGTARLVSPEWVIWAGSPDKFEAGTPAIINIIAFARALCMIRQSGGDIFSYATSEKLSADKILYNDVLEKYEGRELLNKLRETLIGRSTLVPTSQGERPYINLDNSASTSTFEPVWETVRQTLRQSGEIHQEIINKVRSICAEVLGAPLVTYEMIFTSNTTEAINLAAESLGREFEEGTEPVVLSTLLEHSSNDLPWRMVPGSSLIRLSIDKEGFIDLNELETLLSEYNQKKLHGKKRIKLMAVCGASNVLGTYNNLADISRIIHQYGAHLLVDAAQMIAHRKVEMELCGIDYLAFSAHKVYAPFGCGVLAVKKGLLNFSDVEKKIIYSSGDENALGIAALGKAFVILERIGMPLIREEEQALTIHALRGMSKIPGISIYGIKDPDSPVFTNKGGVIVFAMKNFIASRVATELAEKEGIGVRYGCHCAHILIKHLLGVGPRLERFQRIIVSLFPKLNLPGLVRVSFGIGNNEKEIDTLIKVLGRMAGKSRSSEEILSDSEQYGEPPLRQAKIKKLIKDFTRTASMRVYSRP